MITESYMYWLLKLDDIRDAMIPFIILSISTLIISCSALVILYATNDEDYVCNKKLAFRFAAMSLVWCVINTAVMVFTPSTKQMAMIKVIPMIANNEVVKDMPADAKEIYKLGIQAIKEQLTGKEQGK